MSRCPVCSSTDARRPQAGRGRFGAGWSSVFFGRCPVCGNRLLPFRRANERPASVLVGRCCWAYLLAVLASWALLGFADRWWPATLLMFGPRWLLALPFLVLAPVAAHFRRRSLAVLFLALVLVLGPVMGLCLPWRSFFAGSSESRPIRVMTWNVHYGRPSADTLQAFLDEAQPDIVACQEWHTPKGGNVFAEPEWHTQRTENMFLASRFPIREVRGMGDNSMDEAGNVVRYALETPLGPLYVFSLHLATPRHAIQDAVDEDRRDLSGIEANTDLRRRQMERLSAEAGLAPGPVFLAGDFNTPVESTIFRQFWGSYTDAFESAGWGWGFTFISRKSQVRIDHILAGPGWGCSRCWVGPNLGSPHRPVVADLVWTGIGE